MSKNLSYLSGKKGIEENLFEKIERLAAETGSPDPQAIQNLSDDYLMGTASIYGAASFYDFSKKSNRGKKIYVCNGSSCMTAGTQSKVYKALEKEVSPEEIGHICCLGRCHENAAFQFRNSNYSGLDEDQILELLKGKKQSSKDSYQVSCSGTAVLTEVLENMDSYAGTLKKCLDAGVNSCMSEIRNSGLRGRGGAGFPIAFKLEACANEEADEKYIVCNADEGDPGAFTDRYIMEENPFTLLFGMTIAGLVSGAEWGVLYIRAEYPDSVEIISKALAKLEGLNLAGENIMGSGKNFRMKVVKGLGSYVCGEETALLSSLEGQRPEVRIRPPYPTQEGLFNKPTVVNNVETLANLWYIMKEGGEAFASIGTEKSTGTKLISLDSYFNHPGVVEVDMGTSLKELIEIHGGGFRAPVKAIHIGGPLGGLVPAEMFDKLQVDFESFQENGFLLGHASMLCIPEWFPLIKYLAHLFRFTADESCGKCFPCRLGSVRGYELLNKAQKEDYRVDRELFDDLVDTLEKTSLCALGGGLPLPVKNALQYFEEELSPYFTNTNHG